MAASFVLKRPVRTIEPRQRSGWLMRRESVVKVIAGKLPCGFLAPPVVLVVSAAFGLGIRSGDVIGHASGNLVDNLPHLAFCIRHPRSVICRYLAGHICARPMAALSRGRC